MTGANPTQRPAPAHPSSEHLSESASVVRVGNDPDTDDPNAGTARPMHALTADLIGQGRCPLVVDPTGLGLIDSTGLLMLRGTLVRTRARGGDVALVVTSERVRKIFRITGPNRHSALCDSVGRAVEQPGRHGADAAGRRVPEFSGQALPGGGGRC
ncbi:STAS domain-containing protein [Streptomyces sp. NPDC048737]|uniref:STAS domain-containing protein n=1 Tax=unclassified Streptomyces TaxID=2593676 RepID=UPI0034496578